MCSPRKPGALRGMARPDQRATGALGLLRAPLRAHACSQEALRTYGVNLVARSWWGDKSWEINSPLLPPSGSTELRGILYLFQGNGLRR